MEGKSTNFEMSEQILEMFYCPISGEIMVDPVVTPNGDTYDREYIEKWIINKGTCPVTRNPINVKSLIPNVAMKQLIFKKTPKAIQEQIKLNKSRQPKIKPQPVEPVITVPRPFVNTNGSLWVSTGRGSTSEFATTRELSIFSSQPTPVDVQSSLTRIIASLIRPTVNAPVHVAAPVEDPIPEIMPNFPLDPDFSFITCPSTLRCLISGYNTMNRIEKWQELRNFVVDESRGFMFERNADISYIMNEVDNDYQGHSGSSMVCTMRNLHCISKYGIDQFKERLFN